MAEILGEFGEALGLQVNVVKSKALCSRGVSADLRRSFMAVCPIPFERDLGKYLGFPLVSGRASHNRFKFLIDQVSRRLTSWKTRLLNTAGRIWVRVLSHKYLGRGSVLEVASTPTSSSLWKWILKARDVLRNGFEFKLGDERTSLWFEDWSGQGACGRHIPFIHISDSALTLADVIMNGSWNFSQLSTPVPDFFQ